MGQALQDLLVTRRILERRPRRHVDIGSRIDGFVAHVALFREIEVPDLRLHARLCHSRAGQSALIAEGRG